MMYQYYYKVDKPGKYGNISQSQKTPYYVKLFIWNVKNSQMYHAERWAIA